MNMPHIIITVLGILCLTYGDADPLLMKFSTNSSIVKKKKPLSVKLKDVIIGINILKLNNGELLNILPFLKQLSPKNDTKPQKHNIKNDDETIDDPIQWCGSWSCKNTTVDNDIIGNTVDVVDPEDDLDDDTILGKTINLLASPGLAVTVDESAPDHWNYEEKSRWSDRFPKCGGNRQTPININTLTTPTRTNIPCLQWANYHSNHKYLTLKNNGHTIEASTSYAVGYPPILQGGILTGSYRFYGVHWHWGSNIFRGSEHTFNSLSYPLEMHLVHYNTKFPNIAAAIASDESEALAVVGVLFKPSILSNPGMTIITKAMRSAAGMGTQNKVLPLDHLGLNFLDGYYTYLGSLTTPPCHEIVRWIVLKKMLHIRPSQLKVFRNVLVNGHPIVDNYRDPQPLNGRTVELITNCRKA